MQRKSTSQTTSPKKICFQKQCVSIPRTAPHEEYRNLPPTSFENLRSILRDYLFGKLKPKEQYSLEPRELAVLKYLLKKKFLYTHNADFIRQISNINAGNAVSFLAEHPQRKRTQVFKRMVFTNFWRFMRENKFNVLTQIFGGDQHFNYLEEMEKNRGNIMNDFYVKCFRNSQFKTKFSQIVQDPAFWSFCNSKSANTFDASFHKWMFLIDKMLASNVSSKEEQRVLMKIKFMSLDSNVQRILNLFKI